MARRGAGSALRLVGPAELPSVGPSETPIAVAQEAPEVGPFTCICGLAFQVKSNYEKCMRQHNGK